MKTTTKIVTGFLAASAIALAVPFAAQAGPFSGEHQCGSQKHGRMGEHHERGEMRHMLRGLDLSEAQRDKIFELRHEQAPRMRAYMKQLHASHQALHELAQSGEYDEAKARALAQEGAQVMVDMALARTQMGAQVFQLLSPEQREQLKQRKAGGPAMKHLHMSFAGQATRS